MESVQFLRVGFLYVIEVSHIKGIPRNINDSTVEPDADLKL
jgi:hypothetical protein